MSPALIDLFFWSPLHFAAAVAAFAQFDQAARDRADHVARDRVRKIDERWRSDPHNFALKHEQIAPLKERFAQERWIGEQDLQEWWTILPATARLQWLPLPAAASATLGRFNATLRDLEKYRHRAMD